MPFRITTQDTCESATHSYTVKTSGNSGYENQKIMGHSMLSEVDANLKWHQSKKRSKSWSFCLILINLKKKKQVISMLNLPSPKTNLFWTESGRFKFSVNWLCCTEICTTVFSYSFTTRYATQIKNATVIIMKIAKAISSEVVIISPIYSKATPKTFNAISEIRKIRFNIAIPYTNFAATTFPFLWRNC